MSIAAKRDPGLAVALSHTHIDRHRRLCWHLAASPPANPIIIHAVVRPLVTELTDAGDTVVAEFTGRGVNDGPLGPLPASGKQMNHPFCEILEV